jgi:hypothetical protein
VKREKIIRDYDKYNENYFLPSTLLNKFPDGFYIVNYDSSYKIIGEVKNGEIKGKLKIYQFYNSNDYIVEERFPDSIVRHYYSDWANNGNIYLLSKEILYNRYYNLPKNYYSVLTDSSHYGYTIKLMKVLNYNKSGFLEREYFALKDYRRVGNYKEYYLNGATKYEACYCFTNCDFKNDTFIFNNKLCKEKLFIKSLETYDHTGFLEGSITDVLNNSWYENNIKKQECSKIQDSNYDIKITNYSLQGSKKNEFYYINDSFDEKRKIAYYDNDNLKTVEHYRYNYKTQREELLLKEEF